MKTLAQQIENCKLLTKEILEKYPNCRAVEFELNDIEIEEIKKFDENPRVNVDRLRGLVNSYQGNCVVWANTKKFKSVKPLDYQF